MQSLTAMAVTEFCLRLSFKLVIFLIVVSHRAICLAIVWLVRSFATTVGSSTHYPSFRQLDLREALRTPTQRDSFHF